MSSCEVELLLGLLRQPHLLLFAAPFFLLFSPLVTVLDRKPAH